MLTKEEVALESIEQRVNQLFDQVFSTRPDSKHAAKKPFKVLEETKGTLKEIETRHTVVQQLWKKLPQLAEYLSLDFMDKLGVTDEIKMSLVLASEENLKALSKQLVELKSLQDVINSDSLKDVPLHAQKLEPILQVHLDQKDEVEDVNDRIQSLLIAYNSIITTLSKQFVLWNNMVTQCEIALDMERDAIE